MTLFTRMIGRWQSLPTAASLIAGLLLIAGLGIIFQSERAYDAQKVHESVIQAQILAESVAAPLDFSDPSTAQEAVDALRVNAQTRLATVYDKQGRVFAGFARQGVVVPPRPPAGGPSTDGPITVTAPVISGGERIGTVHLVSVREPLSRRLSRWSLILLFVVMAALVVGVLGIAHAALRRANSELESRARALSAANRELTVQIDEREKAEEQLRQSQKMQAIGQLTGGIAHDFNNLLTVIQGSADILQRPGLSEEKRARYAAAISQTAGRAAALTSQLLAFARRQPLLPETIDLNQQILGMVELLDRTLGERVFIQTQLSAEVCVVDVDPTQLESAILNIAVNARDAMETMPAGGGTLTLRTSLASPVQSDRPAVALAITDTGGGISPETLARVFEPFFTTKDVGRGTGLGLSQVYGFASQSGGDVLVDSTLGEGTTFTLILPCSAHGSAAPDSIEEAKAVPSTKPGRILVVDDNEDVGAFAESLLAELGHRVIRATTGEQALRVMQSFPVDLVFTDVVMPGMGGIELAGRLRELRPHLPIILTTGYSDNITGEAAKGFAILFKPYKLEAVASAVNQALWESTASAA
ncbi:MAG TPA: response regulator [Sphingomonadaceae bacterium]|nr:response regulator [Sphingomonadaceae bacterium]